MKRRQVVLRNNQIRYASSIRTIFRSSLCIGCFGDELSIKINRNWLRIWSFSDGSYFSIACTHIFGNNTFDVIKHPKKDS